MIIKVSEYSEQCMTVPRCEEKWKEEKGEEKEIHQQESLYFYKKCENLTQYNIIYQRETIAVCTVIPGYKREFQPRLPLI